MQSFKVFIVFLESGHKAFIDFRSKIHYDIYDQGRGLFATYEMGGVIMPLMDEFKEERELVKTRTFKEKMSYFWDYYKWHVIGGAVIIFIAVSLIHTFLTRKEMAYYCIFINTVETYNSKDYKNAFIEKTGIDQKKQSVYWDVDCYFDLSTMDEQTVTTTQKIMVYLSAGDLDTMLGDRAAMNRYAYNDVLLDLRTFLTKEELEKYEPYFFYVDQALIKQAEEENRVEINTFPEDPTDPSTMTEPIPVGIRLENCPKFREAYLFGDEQYFCIFQNSKRPELNHLFLNYIME
jgi:hypothetical protein